MHVKSFRRVGLLVVALVVGALSLVTVSATPASAATYNTRTQLSASTSVVKYGSSVKFTGRVITRVGTEDYYTPAGVVRLQRLNYGSSTWATINSKTLNTSSEELTWTYKPAATARYRLLYTGGTIEGDTLNPSTSTPLRTVSVRRNLHDNFSRSSRNFYGTVTPSYGGKTIYIQKSTCSNPQSSSCSWGLYKALKTTSAGKWVVKLPVYSRKTHFRGLVKASSGYLVSYSNFYVSTYRY